MVYSSITSSAFNYDLELRAGPLIVDKDDLLDIKNIIKRCSNIARNFLTCTPICEDVKLQIAIKDVNVPAVSLICSKSRIFICSP